MGRTGSGQNEGVRVDAGRAQLREIGYLGGRAGKVRSVVSAENDGVERRTSNERLCPKRSQAFDLVRYR